MPGEYVSEWLIYKTKLAITRHKIGNCTNLSFHQVL